MPLSDYERTLLRRAQQGDRSAFSDFYLRFQPTIYLEALAIVRTRNDADDLTSETFLRAWNAINRFEDRGYSIEAWLKKIARNLAMSHLRRRGRECTDAELERLVDPALLPEEDLEVQFENETVRQALLGMPEMQRRVLTMRYFEDLTCKQVADVVGRSEGAVRVIQHRALRSLRVLLEKRGLWRGQRKAIDPALPGGGQ